MILTRLVAMFIISYLDWVAKEFSSKLIRVEMEEIMLLRDSFEMLNFEFVLNDSKKFLLVSKKVSA